MFDEKQINAYHSIKAPDRIYKRLKRKNYSIGAIAACLLCVIALSVFFMPEKTEIKINGQVIEKTQIVFENKLRKNEIEIPIDLKIKEKTEISVSKGILVNGEKEEKVFVIDDDAQLFWIVDFEEIPCEISISDKKGVKSFTLIYDNSQYILRRNEK